MPCQVYFENVLLPNVENVVPQSTTFSTNDLKSAVSQRYGLSIQDLFVTINGKTPGSDYEMATCDSVVRIYTKLIGGKGGFGSMLRAIGAQIEKTTNREACRDLSGRRLRDINEEKRLRKWLEGQEDRDKEAVERKQKKLERLMAEPKIEVDLGKEYFEEREALPDRVSAAVEAGWQAAGSSSGTGIKRKAEELKTKKKKTKLWIDADLSECSSTSEDENDEPPGSDQNVSTDSGNESNVASKANSEA